MHYNKLHIKMHPKDCLECICFIALGGTPLFIEQGLCLHCLWIPQDRYYYLTIMPHISAVWQARRRGNLCINWSGLEWSFATSSGVIIEKLLISLSWLLHLSTGCCSKHGRWPAEAAAPGNMLEIQNWDHTQTSWIRINILISSPEDLN